MSRKIVELGGSYGYKTLLAFGERLTRECGDMHAERDAVKASYPKCTFLAGLPDDGTDVLLIGTI